MSERVVIERSDSDVAAFYALLFAGEMLLKTTVAGLVAAVRETRDRHQYRLLHDLVRADAIGDWVKALDEILLGPTSQHLQNEARHEQRQLTQRVRSDSWQCRSVQLLKDCLDTLGIESEQLPTKIAARQWFSLFIVLRNKTRGHGAPRGQQCADAVNTLQESITCFAEHCDLFERPWAYLRRNLSGKYRITPLGKDAEPFSHFARGSVDLQFPDGVYIQFDELSRVHLIESDADASDFLFPNGQFDGRSYEVLSYITNDRRKVPATPFLVPSEPLPPSETEGRGVLELVGECLGNLPEPPSGYVRRPELETKLREQLLLDRHPIITLTGPGGIGKTSLALQVLHDVARTAHQRFEVIIWLSARDIDLLAAGPKPVRPSALLLDHFAAHYVQLLQPWDSQTLGFKATEYFRQALQENPLGPCLYVFDNFETVAAPAELYRWVDTYLRAPNKILITTRLTDFAGDFEIAVGGMAETEAMALVASVAEELGIRDLLTKEYVTDIYRESDGHPYVLKIMLGEVAKAGRPTKPERIIAGQEDMLKALFERSFASLSPAAQRVLLVLCNWRSVVPEAILESVLLRPQNERIDVSGALDELRRLSFVETTVSSADLERFVGVPRSAMAFGRRKLATSPLAAAVEIDTSILRDFGPVRREEVRQGVLPRIHYRLRRIAEAGEKRRELLAENRSLLESLCRRVPAAWLDLAALHEDLGGAEGLSASKECLKRYLESPLAERDASAVWERLARLCRQTGDYAGEILALVSMAQVPEAALATVSAAANRINDVHRQLKGRGASVFDTQEKRALISRVATAMERWTDQMDSTDLSRLAWLHLHLGDSAKAKILAQRGYEKDPNNYYCRSLLDRLGSQVPRPAG